MPDHYSESRDYSIPTVEMPNLEDYPTAKDKLGLAKTMLGKHLKGIARNAKYKYDTDMDKVASLALDLLYQSVVQTLTGETKDLCVAALEVGTHPLRNYGIDLAKPPESADFYVVQSVDCPGAGKWFMKQVLNKSEATGFCPFCGRSVTML